MKKFFLIALLLINPSLCSAKDSFSVQLGKDYLVATDKVVVSSVVSNPEIYTLSPFFTIFNEKNVLLLHPVKLGQSDFTIFLNESETSFSVTVQKEKSPINDKSITKGDFEIMLLDAPPSLSEFNIEPAPVKIKQGGK